MRHRIRDRRALADLRRAAQDLAWLYDRRAGISVAEIARRDGVSRDWVRDGIRRARHAEPAASEPGSTATHRPITSSLVPLFPIGPLTPQSMCPHHGPIPPGSHLICMVCHASGLDRSEVA